jgi:hypothetical protein
MLATMLSGSASFMRRSYHSPEPPNRSPCHPRGVRDRLRPECPPNRGSAAFALEARRVKDPPEARKPASGEKGPLAAFLPHAVVWPSARRFCPSSAILSLHLSGGDPAAEHGALESRL